MDRKLDAPRGLSRRSLLIGTACMATAFTSGALAETPKMAEFFKTKDELDASLKSFGVGPLDRVTLLHLARPTTMLITKASADSEIPVGASKIGGAPDLPEALAWPMRQPSASGKRDVEVLRKLDAEKPSDYYKKEIAEKEPLANREAPLAFMLQVDFAAAAAAGPLDPDLPTSGRLLVFYDLVMLPWFGEQEKEKSLALIYLDDPQVELKRRPIPDLGMPTWGERREGESDEEAMRLPPARIEPRFSYTLPGSGTYPMMTRFAYPQEPPHNAWLEARTASPGAGCQLLGWPDLVQYDPAIDLGAADIHYDLPHNDSFIPTIRGLAGPIENWIPLLSITGYDTDAVDFNGGYYIMIRRTDLKKRDFSKAVIVYQTD
ncbi:DUF1963 domain-containing protein [Allorhizobium taibaishanense]|nr:DUF1963 domain-containing protein [Allorhizobium taibaishanense]MBB4007139.1 uncharacterized protein YwqG [Allorhizobium taibaishanense]